MAEEQPEDKAKARFNPLGLFAEFWLDVLVLLAFGYGFAQVSAQPATVIAVCRAVWLAFHVLYTAVYLVIKPRVEAIPEPDVRMEEEARLDLLRRTFLIKAAFTLFLHIVTELPQPLLMGGVVSTLLASPFRRDYANSFIKKYLFSYSPQRRDSDSSPPRQGSTSPQAGLAISSAPQKYEARTMPKLDYKISGVSRQGAAFSGTLLPRASLRTACLRLRVGIKHAVATSVVSRMHVLAGSGSSASVKLVRYNIMTPY